MKLSVIIVSYKVKFYAEQCLLSLKKAIKGIEAEIYVVDNHSNDGSVEFLTERFPDIHIINSNHNLGFSRANNLAIKQSSGQYVLLLNPDTIVGENTIKTVLEFMEQHPKAGGAGVKMLKDDGTAAMESRRGLPTPLTSLYKMTGLCACYPQSRRFGKYYMSYLSWDKPERIEVMSGAFCMLRRDALDKIGLLDEDFFMYGEDIDLSYRLLKGGFENWYIPSPILHYKGESAHKSSFRYVHVFYEAMLIFFRKHYGNMTLLISIPIKTAIYVKAMITLVQMQWTSMRKKLGFINHKHKVCPLYIFIAPHHNIEQCRTIAHRKGLTAQFVEGDSTTMPNGYNATNLQPNLRTYMVYDTSAFTYEQIFNIFSNNNNPYIRIGTFTPSTQTIITGEEVLK